MNCFICDLLCDPQAEDGAFIKSTFTNKSKKSYSTILYDILKSLCTITIYDDDVACKTCVMLIEELDNYMYNLTLNQNLLTRQIFRKYNIPTKNIISFSFLEERAKSIFENKSNGSYSCSKCPFKTQYQDTMTPHFKFHQNHDQILSSTNEDVEHPTDTEFICDLCDMKTNTDINLKLHMILTHNYYKSLKITAKPVIKEEYPDSKSEENPQNYNEDIDMDDLIIENDKLDMNEDQDTDYEEKDISLIQHEEGYETRDLMVTNYLKIEKLDAAQLYNCALCIYKGTSFAHIRKHFIQNHSTAGKDETQQKRTCKICSVEFNDVLELMEHSKIHKILSFQCSTCLFVATCQETVRAHIKIQHPQKTTVQFMIMGEKKYMGSSFDDSGQCLVCGNIPKEVPCDHTDAIAAGLEKILCSECNKIFFDPTLLLDHKEKIHFICKICNQVKFSHQKLTQHIKYMHESEFKCDICSKVYKRKSELKYHISIHTGKKYKYFCNICNRNMRSKSHLDRHMPKHTKEDKFICDICGQKFSYQTSCRIHRLWHDDPTPFPCDICGSKFKHPSLRAKHRRNAHTGQKAYTCKYCSKVYTSGSTLKEHLSHHTGVYLYNCATCTIGFTKRLLYGKHMAKVHNDYSILNEKRVCEYKMKIRPDITKDVSIEATELIDSESDELE